MADSHATRKIIPAIVLIGGIAGTLDIAAAFINFYLSTGKNPMRVLEFIASGVFGKEAFAGNPMMPFYGLLFHYSIATWWAVLFYFLYLKINVLGKHWIISGTVYAVIVWMAMTRIVLPLSNVPQQPFVLTRALLAIVILIFCIGLPISYGIKKYFSSTTNNH